MLRGNLSKKQGTHWCCVGTYRKQKENNRFAWEPMETKRKHVFCVGTYKTKRKHNICVGTDGKHTENAGFACEPIENGKKT